MKMSRRGFATMLGVAPLGAGVLAKNIGNGLASGTIGGTQAFPPEAPYPGSFGGAAQVNKSRMTQWQAIRLAMLDPDLKALIVAGAWKQCRDVHSIDPDIQVLKAMSPMAKIVFQRQRNVQRTLDEYTNEPFYSASMIEKVQNFIHKCMWG